VPVKVCPSKVKVTSTGDVVLWLAGSADLDVNRVDLASLDLFGAPIIESKLENKTAPPTGPLVGQTGVPVCGGKDHTMDVVLKFDRRTVVQGIERVLGRTLAKGELVALTLIGRLKPEHGGVRIIGETIMEVDR
jgi:hypothetical protein